MEDVIRVADYISQRYKNEFGEDIDEMKLHKMMYFAQRESYIMYKEPLFEAIFFGWKYGPVLYEVRKYYKGKDYPHVDIFSFCPAFVTLMDRVFQRYAAKSSWSLSRLTHGELSWKNSRIGVEENENGNNPIDNNDIAKDADRVRLRMEILELLNE